MVKAMWRKVLIISLPEALTYHLYQPELSKFISVKVFL